MAPPVSPRGSVPMSTRCPHVPHVHQESPGVPMSPMHPCPHVSPCPQVSPCPPCPPCVPQVSPMFPHVPPCPHVLPCPPMSPNVPISPCAHAPHVPPLSPHVPPCPPMPPISSCVPTSPPHGDAALAGLCVAVPQWVTVTQEVYVGLKLPPSIRPHEQLQLLPHVHNRLPRSINVSPQPPRFPSCPIDPSVPHRSLCAPQIPLYASEIPLLPHRSPLLAHRCPSVYRCLSAP